MLVGLYLYYGKKLFYLSIVILQMVTINKELKK